MQIVSAHINSIYFCFFLCSASELLTEAGLSSIFLEYIDGTRLVELRRLLKKKKNRNVVLSVFHATCFETVSRMYLYQARKSRGDLFTPL